MKTFLGLFLGVFLFLNISCHAVQTLDKVIYYYDADTDTARNKIVQNHAYSTEHHSYEINHHRTNNDERAARFFYNDIYRKTIMDFGCCEGGVLLACRRLGAKKIIGVDANHWGIEKAIAKAKEDKIKNAQFFVGDVENKAVLSSLPQVDTVLFLAVLYTSKFSDRAAVISNVARFAKTALYYEGHCTPESHVSPMFDFVKYTDFTRFEYLGRFDGRILFRCGRETMKANQVPYGAVTSDDSDEDLLQAEEIYIYSDSTRNPAFSENCRLIQFVQR